MTFEAYQEYFQDILKNNSNPRKPYDNPDYMSYTELNWARMERWLKKGVLTEELKTTLGKITQPQQWILITEPWCGDAAHSTPFIYMMSTQNPLIQLNVELRDSAPHRIEQYLTNGGKSIPKLIIRDIQGNDLDTWGPRPAACQEMYKKLVDDKADFEAIKIALQHWYNKNEGVDIQSEINTILKKNTHILQDR